MKPTIEYNSKRTEVAIAPVTEQTEITIVRRAKYIVLYQNDELIDMLDTMIFPIMRVVRMVRIHAPQAMITVR